jgi:predicted Fe-S protein YdhL (DUF1289 family)
VRRSLTLRALWCRTMKACVPKRSVYEAYTALLLVCLFVCVNASEHHAEEQTRACEHSCPEQFRHHEEDEQEQRQQQQQRQLETLGPVALGKDGSIHRIANWHELTPSERAAAQRAISRRNQDRKQKLLEAEAEAQARARTPLGRLRAWWRKLRRGLADPYSSMWRKLRRLFARAARLAPAARERESSND